MDKDRIKGSAEQAKGAVKKAAGKVFGDKKLETDGKADKAAGKVQNAIGGLKDAVRGKVRPAPSTEASHGIDPDYRCISAAVWWRRRILGSQSRLLVTGRCGPSGVCSTGFGGSLSRLTLIASICAQGGAIRHVRFRVE
jgi:uncharacterized protein YjbJ (UPF0337 family)